MEAKEFINKHRNDIEKSNPVILNSLSGSIDRLQKAFPRYESFLMEFLQNADDENSSKFDVRLNQDRLIISNDGNPFTEKNVLSLCAVGNSEKSLNNYIGYLGVGFKSVFLISDLVQVISPPYYFSFSKHHWNGEKFPWQVTPIWSDELMNSNSGFNTTFVIHLKTREFIERIQSELTSNSLNNRILLFLKNINSILLEDELKSQSRIITKSLVEQNEDYLIWNIQEGTTSQNWLTINKDIIVPSEVKLDQVTKDWERSNVEVRSVSAVYKLKEDNSIVPETNATAHIGVFSFIPLREIQSGLKFLIQADFITNLGRGDIERDSKWNKWIADEIKNLIIDKCIPIFKSNEKWKYNFTSILYSSATTGHKLFFENILLPVNRFMVEEKVLITESNNFATKDEIVWMDDDFIDLLEEGDQAALYPGKQIMNRNCCPFIDENSNKIKSREYDPIAYNEFGKSIIQLKLSNNKLDWFEKLYKFFLKKYDYRYFKINYSKYNVKYREFWNRLAQSENQIIPTINSRLVSALNCYLNYSKLEIPQILRDLIEVPHPQIELNPTFINFMERLRDFNKNCFKELSEKKIKHILVEQDVLQPNEDEWNNKSPEEKNEFIKVLFSVNKKLDLKKFEFLDVLTKNNKWVAPNKIFFPSEYEPEKQKLELLKSKGVIDFELEFLSTDYLKLEGATTSSIKTFFSQLGVDSEVTNKNLIERVGIKKALLFEQSENRKVRELGGSENPGYDVESSSENGDRRYIEVKSTAANTTDIFLSSNEYLSMKKEVKNYFVYVVTDALRDPILHIVRGEELNSIDETKVTFPYNKWYPKKIQ